MHHDFAPRAVEPPQRQVDAADDDRKHIVEVVGDSAGELPDRLHLLHLAELRLGRLALGRFGFERVVRFPQLLGPLAHRLFELLGAHRLGLGRAARLGVLTERLDGDDSEEDCADPDEDPEPAEIVGELIGLIGRCLTLLDTARAGRALGTDDVLELVVESLARARLGGGVEIADAGVAFFGEGRLGRERELAAKLGIEPLDLGHAPALRGIVAHLGSEFLIDLVAGELPVAGVDVAAGLHVLVEHEAGERGLGARDVGADVADDKRDFVGVALGAERAFAGIVGELHHDDHGDEDQGREQARGRGAPAAPVEADFLVVPSPHGRSLPPLTFRRNPKVPGNLIS